MTYIEFTEYKRYVDLKKLNFIISCLQNKLPVDSMGLEIGCGAGNISLPLASLGFEIFSFDISLSSVKNADHKKKILGLMKNPNFFVGDACNIPISENESFDFVILSEVLEHVKQPHELLIKINKVLKKNGFLIITVPNGFGTYSLIMDYFRNKIVHKVIPIIPPSEHINYFSINKINELLFEAGFEIQKRAKSDFISWMPLIVNSKTICTFDCKLADLLPYGFVSGWYLCCKKMTEDC